MDPGDAERLAAEKMRWLGFLDARVTTGGADGGIDVVAHDGIAQVKAWAKPVGVTDVRELKGIAAASSTSRTPVFFSTSGYTAPAITFGQEAGVALFDMTGTGGLMARSRSAEKLMSGERSAELREAHERRQADGAEVVRLQNLAYEDAQGRTRQRRREAIESWVADHASLDKEQAQWQLHWLLSWKSDGEGGTLFSFLEMNYPFLWPADVEEAWGVARVERQASLDTWAQQNASERDARSATVDGYEKHEVRDAWDRAREELRETEPSIQQADRLHDAFVSALMMAMAGGLIVLLVSQSAVIALVVVVVGTTLGAPLMYFVGDTTAPDDDRDAPDPS